MPTAMLCHETKKADSKEEAISQFMDSVHGDINKLIYADTNFTKHKGLRGYFPPHNDFEILMTCIIESLCKKPNRLYQLQTEVDKMSAADINLLIHLQLSYEYAKENVKDKDAIEKLAKQYKAIAMATVSVEIREYDIPKVMFKSADFHEGCVTALMSYDVPFDIYDDGRIMCKSHQADQIRKILKEVGTHVRKI